MTSTPDLFHQFQQLTDMGGPVLWLIIGLILLLWLLLIERLIYYRTALQSDIAQCLHIWNLRSDRHSRYARHIRNAFRAEINSRIDRSLAFIKTLVALAPLFGLLGTVTGMVGVFESMAIAEGGARAMSDGVSRATIPTMAGMVAALSGLVGLTGIERMARQAKTHLDRHLLMDEPGGEKALCAED